MRECRAKRPALPGFPDPGRREEEIHLKLPVRNALILFLAASIWGTAFVAQRLGMDYVGPFTFNAARYLAGGLVLVPVILFRRQVLHVRAFRPSRNLQAGIFCGLFLFAASSLQQAALLTTDVGKAGFLTAMYIILVPVFHFFMGRPSGIRLWISVAIAAAGLYFLSVQGGFYLERGDLLLILCAGVFSLHILCVDHFSPDTDPVIISSLQFFTAAALSLAFALPLEEIGLPALAGAAWPILYAGIFSCGVAYTCQIIGQKGADPSYASLILSLESVISVLSGFLILGQALTARELLGCGLMFLAILLVQLPEGKREAEAGKTSP